MKKFLSIILSITIIMSMVSTASASHVPANETEKNISANGYNFTVTESTTSDYVVSRTYSKDTSSMTRSISSLDETKAMLLALGMNEEEVDAIPTDTLYDFATSKDVTVTTSHTKHNESSNLTVRLPEETALQEAAALSEQQEQYFIQQGQGISVVGDKPNDSDAPGLFEDSYMRIVHSALHQGGGAYKFTVSASWLTMPFFRGYDSIGACAMNATVTPGTSSGRFWYKIKLINGGNISTSYSDRITITERYNRTNGNWHGSAGVFNLPNDISNPNTGVSIMNTDLRAYYEYEGHVNEPGQELYFNAAGTYTHSIIDLGISPSVSLDTSGEFSAAIGITPSLSTDVRTAEREIHYRP